MDNYSFRIRNDKPVLYLLTTALIAVVSLLVFAYITSQVPVSGDKVLPALGILTNFLILAGLIYERKQKSNSFRSATIGFFLSALLFFFLNKPVIALLIIFFALMGMYSNRDWIIRITQAGIRYPSFPPRNIAWADVEQVIFKDNVLTIDLKNNRFWQFNVNVEWNKAQVDAFNLFCRTQISLSSNQNK